MMENERTVAPGASYTCGCVVAEEMTACRVGSGDLPVLATPSMVALMENAAMKAVSPLLSAAETTVGGRVEVVHLLPTPVGASVEVSAVLESVDGRRLTFKVVAREGEKLIGEGSHVRFVVDRVRFMDKVCASK